MDKFVMYYGFCYFCSENYIYMAKKKEECPECCTYTITIKNENCNILWDEQNRLKKERDRHYAIELIINKIITEWKVDRDVERALNK